MKNIWLRKKEMYPRKEDMEKWGKVNSKNRSMLDGLDEHAAYHVAILLENQRLFNEAAMGTTGCGFLDAMMKRISIQVVRRTYDPKNLLISNMVSIQSMLGPCSLLCYQEDEKSVIQEAVAISRKLKTQFPVFFSKNPQEGFTKYRTMSFTAENLYLTEDYSKYHTVDGMGIDNEAEMTCYMTEQRVNEITAEIITDIRNNVGSTVSANWNNMGLADGHKYWVIANPHTLIKNVAPDMKSNEPYDLRRVGCFDFCTLYSYEKMPENEVLVGIQQKDPNMRSYVYAPYTPFSVAGQICFDCRGPEIPHDETHNTRLGLLTRGAKRLALDGSKFFGKIILDS